MNLKYTLNDLNNAFTKYCEGSIKNIDELTPEQRKENFIYLKAIHEFLDYFTDEYCNDFIAEKQQHIYNVYKTYKEKYFSDVYKVKVYGQEYDASTADPVILEGIIAADKDELERKIRTIAWKEHAIYNMTSYEVITENEDRT